LITSSGTVHTLNIPYAGVAGTVAGLLSNSQYQELNSKQGALTAGAGITIASGTISATDATSSAKGIVKLTNDLGGSAEFPTVNSVGGVSSSTITTVASAVNSATASNTPNIIVKRDETGGFAAAAITSTSLTTGALKVTSSTPTVGAVLTASSTDGTVAWSTSNTASSLTGGEAGVIPYQTAPNTTGFTAVGTSGQLLVSGGTLTPTWTSNISVGTVTATSMTATGNISANTLTADNFTRSVASAPASAYTSTTATTISFSGSNLAYSGQSSPTFTLSNLRDGGTYTLAWQNTTTGLLASFSSTGFNFISLGNYNVVSSKHAVYTFMVMGTIVYFSMVSGQ
jgi:hypothetical protein